MGFAASFSVALKGLVRSKAFWLLLAAVAAVHWFVPDLVRSDGSDAGALEMHVRGVVGGAAAVVLLSTLAMACGALARERETRRLPLSLVRPASAFALLLGERSALVAVSCGALALSFALLVAFPPPAAANARCFRHVQPALPPPEVSAAAMLERYLADPSTPDAIRNASRRTVLDILAAKESDRYEVIRPGESAAWPMDLGGVPREGLLLRVRFASEFESRASVQGTFQVAGLAASVSNNTQAVLTMPLHHGQTTNAAPDNALSFSNTGRGVVMVRPRHDLAVLAPADGFTANAARSYVLTLALAALFAAAGLFLSAGLSRPVALFSAFVFLAAVFTAPQAVAQYPNELEAGFVDRMGLFLSRVVTSLTASFTESSPVADLATGKHIAAADLVRALAKNALLLPAIFLACGAWASRRKPA